MGRPSRHLGNFHRPALLGDAKPQATERQHPCPCDIPHNPGDFAGCSLFLDALAATTTSSWELRGKAPPSPACAVHFPKGKVHQCIWQPTSGPTLRWLPRGPSSTFLSIDRLHETPGSERRRCLTSSACPVVGKEATAQLAYCKRQGRGSPACRAIIGGTGATSSFSPTQVPPTPVSIVACSI